jgi:ribosomal protein S18 acetylase RimI-like enzyme
MRLEITAFRESDRAAVIDIWESAFPNDPAHNRSDDMIDRKLRVQPDLFLVARDGDRVLGAVMAGYDGVRGWIHRLAVSESARRRGVGTLLMQAAEAGLARLGCPKVNLQIRSANASVIAFYRSVGYEVDDNVSMGRRLDGRLPKP